MQAALAWDADVSAVAMSGARWLTGHTDGSAVLWLRSIAATPIWVFRGVHRAALRVIGFRGEHEVVWHGAIGVSANGPMERCSPLFQGLCYVIYRRHRLRGA